jgi:hypothetical protein
MTSGAQQETTATMRKLIVPLVVLSLALLAACGDDADGATATPTEIPDPNSITDPQGALDAARARWAVEGGDSYDMSFNWQCFCVVDYVARVDLEVRGGAVTAGTVEDTGDALPADRLADYETVDELFDLIQDAIDQDAYEIRTSYDSTGYPDEVWIDYDAATADEERGFFIHSLTVN